MVFHKYDKYQQNKILVLVQMLNFPWVKFEIILNEYYAQFVVTVS